MTLQRKQLSTILGICGLLITVLYVGTFIDEPVKQATNENRSTAQLERNLQKNDLRDKELETIKNDLATLEPKEAYELFKKRNADHDSGVQHDYAHLFGQELYNSAGIPGVAICDATFAFGCFHSFFGHALMEHGNDIIFELEKECIEAFGPKGLGCQHGIGHGVISELGAEELKTALEICMQLQWKGPLGGCMSGVHMEYNFNTMNNGPARTLDPRDPYYPCSTLDDQYQEGCYFELPQWWFRVYSNEPDDRYGEVHEIHVQVGKNCEAIEDEKDRVACFRGLGNTLAGVPDQTIESVRNGCSLSPNETGRLYCLEGAAWLLSWEPKYEDSWRELCDGLTGESEQICLTSADMI